MNPINSVTIDLIMHAYKIIQSSTGKDAARKMVKEAMSKCGNAEAIGVVFYALALVTDENIA